MKPLNWRPAQNRRHCRADKRITNTEGGSFNSHYGVKVFGNSHGMLQGYCSTRHSLSSCVIAEENGDMERDYAYTIGRAMSDLQTPEWVGGRLCSPYFIAPVTA